MKKILFWVSQPVLIPVLVIGLSLEWVGECITKLCHAFEGWAFEYEKRGWKHLGEGIYRWKGKDEQ